MLAGATPPVITLEVDEITCGFMTGAAIDYYCPVLAARTSTDTRPKVASPTAKSARRCHPSTGAGLSRIIWHQTQEAHDHHDI
jgi:hypothetical protein